MVFARKFFPQVYPEIKISDTGPGSSWLGDGYAYLKE